MPENASVFDQVLNGQKASVKHKWRGKLFSNEGKLKKSTEASENDVLDFLNTSWSKDDARGSQDLLVPRIDTSAARRWPSTAEVIQSTINQPERLRKPPRKIGLQVTFESAAPEVIGEGGDEAELPVITISKSREQFTPQQSLQASNVGEATSSPLQAKEDKQQIYLQDSSLVDNIDISKPPPLHRRPTGLIDPSREGDSPLSNLGSPGGELSPSTQSSNSPQRLPPLRPFRHSVLSEASISLQDAESREAKQDIIEELTHPNESNPLTNNTSVDATTPKLNVPSFDASLSTENSITPIPSPQPSLPIRNASLSHRRTLVFGSEYFAVPVISSDEPPKARLLKEDESQKPLLEPRVFSIRDVAKNLGDDALEDFASRVHRFNAIFQIGATVTSLVMSIPFIQWIRTGAYWFLKGRGELEIAVRTEARAAQGSLPENDSCVSIGLRQAYLDLAKAWWILENITTNHPEPRKFGSASMSSLVAIVKSFGDVRLAELIGVHLGITANMRALTMSMKRNGRLPPVSFEIQGLETRIFVEFPTLPSNVGVVLSEHSQSLAGEDPRKAKPFFPIPVGDTKCHFVYSSVMVDLIFASQDNQSKEIRLPCVLTILRERSDWDLQAVIASQDGKVNLLIQSDKHTGLTWDKVGWKIKSSSIRLKLSERVDIHVQFSEKDFKTFWGIHDYTRKVQEGLRCWDGEQLVFKDSLKSFQNIDQQSAKLFPAEPVRNCSLRLFEKKPLLSEGNERRRMHGGYRLIIVTPPSTKTLSSVSVDIDKKTPILFSYLRGEDSAPALLLKLSKPSVDSSMLMAFQEATNRGLFHSLIDGTSVSPSEICSQPLLLDSFTIFETMVEGLPFFPGQNFVNALRWQQLRVINKGPKSPSHSNRTAPAENLRIWTECEIGSFVDRMNFGE